jgi:hypothetical protein
VIRAEKVFSREAAFGGKSGVLLVSICSFSFREAGFCEKAVVLLLKSHFQFTNPVFVLREQTVNNGTRLHVRAVSSVCLILRHLRLYCSTSPDTKP